MIRSHPLAPFVLAVLLALGASSTASAARTECRLTYDLEGWSVFYKTSKGSGRITCSNGQSANVRIQTHGGGFSFGTNQVIGGKGVFSSVVNISDLYGGYAEAGAHAGAGRSVAARFMLKGNVNLSLYGSGQGVSLGFAFGGFRIEPR